MPRAALIAAAGACALAPLVALGATGDISSLGLMPGGAPATEPVRGAAFSPDGRYVLITSTAALSGVPTGGVRQLFLRDRATGTIAMVSTSAQGEPANASVDDPDTARAYGASLQGRFVVFATEASNLVPGDGNGATDVFRKDTLTGRIVLISRDTRGAPVAGGVTGQPSISSDGAKVAFTSGDGALLAADTNGVADIYMANLRARGALTLVSQTAAGVQSPQAVGHPSISADGAAIAFDGTAAASVLAGSDSDGNADVYVARPRARTIAVASRASGGSDNGDSSLPSISGDGSMVAFSSSAQLVAADGDSDPDAYVRDLGTGATRRVSPAAISDAPAISADGARVAFAGATAGGDGADANADDDVYVRTLAGDALFRASRTATGDAPAQASTRAAISGAGDVASFTTAPVGGTDDAWVTDLGSGTAGAPSVTATARLDGRRLTVSGRATDPAGVVSVRVGRRYARIADTGAYSVTFTAPIGTELVTVTATNGVGARAATTVATTRAAASRGPSPRAVRPRAVRVRVTRPWARVQFSLPTRAAWRVELRKPVAGSRRAPGFTLVAARSGRPAKGRRVTRIRIPARTKAGSYQVRILIASSRGLGTIARTITLP